MSGTITMTGEEYDALHAKAEVLDVLCQSRFDEIAQLKAEAEALRAENGRLRDEYDRDVYGLNNEGDPIGGDPAGGIAPDRDRHAGRRPRAPPAGDDACRQTGPAPLD